MVTSNKLPEKKVVRMSDQVNNPSVPQRTLLGVINEHITCRLCRGYYIDATTIVECLHSFCRSCIIKHLQKNSYCPVCEMMINSAKPNIKLDKALQDIVYKLVPGLFQKEMDRRRQFYASRPGTAAAATPEQRGEDTERIIFSPEDVISFSLEFIDATDADSISSKSSDSNESQVGPGGTRRFLQCPAVVNISHLKKFLSMKFDIDSTQFSIDILYKRVQLADYYTLMDVAYIYNWKRNEPMRFYYQIIDRVALAMRSRLFDINRKDPNFQDRKSNLPSPGDININSPAPNNADQTSEASSGTDSPMPEDRVKKAADTFKKDDKNGPDISGNSRNNTAPVKKVDEEVEKSQFLNSFELTAKSNGSSLKSSPVKDNGAIPKASPTKDNIITAKLPSTPVKSSIEGNSNKSDITKSPQNKEQAVEHKDTSLKNPLLNKIEDNLKRKTVPPTSVPELKKVKIELEKSKLPISQPLERSKVQVLQPSPDTTKKNTSLHSYSASKAATSSATKTVSPLKLQMPKIEPTTLETKTHEIPKPLSKKIPDLRPAAAVAQGIQSKPSNKSHSPNKIRMDLLSNNCDPTNDRSKMMAQVKVPMSAPPTSPGGDPLKSMLFDSCKINIPSSLSITLTDQKQEARNPDQIIAEQSKPVVNKNLASATASNTAHKAPSPPVHNYIEILKLPDSDTKKNVKPSVEPPKPPELKSQSKPPIGKSETSAKGPVPNLKPISDTKLSKQSPKTFQQTFEQQLLGAKSDKTGKPAKAKPQVPKLMPATPKTFGVAAGKMAGSNLPPSGTGEQKPSSALDLSSAHNMPLGPQQTKAFETMQSIANLAKKQASISTKSLSPVVPQTNMFSSITNRPLPLGPSPLRIPSTNNTAPKSSLQSYLGNLRQEMVKSNAVKQTSSSPTPAMHQSPTSSSLSTAQPSPRQTRSPSSSPKLVIAEDKQSSNSSAEHNVDQSNMISSSQVSSQIKKTDSPKSSPGPSRPGLKPLAPAGKITGIRQPITPTVNKPNLGVGNATDFFATQPQMLSHHALLRHQMDHLQNWYKAQQRQYDLMNNRTNAAHPAQKDFVNKEKQ